MYNLAVYRQVPAEDVTSDFFITEATDGGKPTINTELYRLVKFKNDDYYGILDNKTKEIVLDNIIILQHMGLSTYDVYCVTLKDLTYVIIKFDADGKLHISVSFSVRHELFNNAVLIEREGKRGIIYFHDDELTIHEYLPQTYTALFTPFGKVKIVTSNLQVSEQDFEAVDVEAKSDIYCIAKLPQDFVVVRFSDLKIMRHFSEVKCIPGFPELAMVTLKREGDDKERKMILYVPTFTTSHEYVELDYYKGFGIGKLPNGTTEVFRLADFSIAYFPPNDTTT